MSWPHLFSRIHVSSIVELKERLLKGIAEINETPVVFRWKKFEKGYIANYFHYEEDFLRSHSYPKLEEHIVEHRKIRAQVAIYAQQITDGCDVSSEICLLLREWIMTHIGIHDVDYEKLLESCA